MAARRVCASVKELRSEFGKDIATIHDWLASDPRNVYVGRRNFYTKIDKDSKWHNPYKLSKYSREEALRLYRERLYESGLIKDIEELRGKNLACYCPRTEACHVDVLIEELEKRATPCPRRSPVRARK